MIKKIYSVALATAIIAMATNCQQANRVKSSESDSAAVTKDASLAATDTTLFARLECKTTNPSLKDSLIIEFTVINPTADTLKFTTYHTPFEGIISKFLDVKDSEGNEAGYQGPMAKRIMPPPASTYHTVAPGQSESVLFDLKKGYKIEKAGTYTLQYNSELISGIANGQPITIEIR